MSGTSSFYTKGIKVSTTDNKSAPKKLNVSGVRQVKTPKSVESVSVKTPSKKKSKKKTLNEDEPEDATSDQEESGTDDTTQNDDGSGKSKSKKDVNVRKIHSMKDLISQTKTKVTIEKLDPEEQSLLGSQECSKFKITVENENGTIRWNQWNTSSKKEPSETSVLISLGKDAKKMGEIHEVGPWKKEFNLNSPSSEETTNKIFEGYQKMVKKLKDIFPGEIYDKFIKLSN